MKIALVRKKFTFHGGAELDTMLLSRELSARSHDVHVYAARWEGHISGVTLHKLLALPLTPVLRDLSFALSAYTALKDEHFDLIQSNDKTLYQDIYRAGDGCHIAWLRQRGRMISSPFKRLTTALNPYHRLVLWLERMILGGRRFRRVLALSEVTKREVMEFYKVPPELVEVIPNGVDLQRFNPSHRAEGRRLLQERHGIGQDETVALFMGSGFERKGVPYLVRALERVKGKGPLTALVAGKGKPIPFNDPSGMRRLVFAGPVREAPLYFAGSDMFVFPSIYEPFGNVILEAMASGLPVVTNSNCGAAELITDGVEGYVAKAPDEIDAIASAMDALLAPSLREAMGAAARRKAEGYGVQAQMDRLMEFYARVAEEKRVSG